MTEKRVHASITGLKELRRDLVSANKRYGPEIRKVLKATAEIVAVNARSRVQPSLTGMARRSIKAGTSGASSSIKGGQKTVPYYGWLDFGGKIRPRGFTIERDVIKTPGNKYNGRYIYPAIKAKLPAAVQYLNRTLHKLILTGDTNI